MSARDFKNRLDKDINEYINNQKLKTIEKFDKENEYYINIDLSDEGYIYDPYSNKESLNSDIYDYIDESYKLFEKKLILKFNIKYPLNMSEDEKNKIYSLIKLHYALGYKKTRRDVKRTNYISFGLLLSGLILFGIYIVFENNGASSVVLAVMDILYTVFIWEAASLFAFTNNENRFESIKYMRVFDALNNSDK